MLNVITILLACVQYQSSTCDFLKVLFVQLDGDGLNPNVVQRKCWNSQDSNSIPLSWIESDKNRMNQSKVFDAESISLLEIRLIFSKEYVVLLNKLK